LFEKLIFAEKQPILVNLFSQKGVAKQNFEKKIGIF